jgi:hypothetical protein
MSCKCGPWEKRSIEGQMRICSAERTTRGGMIRKGVFAVAVQRDQDDRRKWEAISKWGPWPSELVAGGFETMDEAKVPAMGRLRLYCEKLETMELNGARRR